MHIYFCSDYFVFIMVLVSKKILYMGRRVNPASMYRVSIHKTNGYRYASTQPSVFDEVSGKKVHYHVHWGVVDDNLKFYPGKNYFYADIEERSKLIFPQDWDLSELSRFYGQNTVNIVNVNAEKTDIKKRNVKKDEVRTDFADENEIGYSEEIEEEMTSEQAGESAAEAE